MLVFILLNILDVLTTRSGLRKGAVEANPVGRFILGRYGVKGLWYMKMAGFGVIALFGFMGWLAEKWLWLINAGLGVVVAWNSLMNFRLKK